MTQRSAIEFQSLIITCHSHIHISLSDFFANMQKFLSSGEKSFVEHGCRENIRYDGRSVTDFRQMSIENDIFPHCHGSSRVSIRNSADVLCGVKMVVETPQQNAPKSGMIQVSVDLSPSCLTKTDEKKLQDLNILIAHELQSLLVGSKCQEQERLCIIPGKFVWCAYIDINILQLDGDPTDMCTIAIYSALAHTRIPKTEVYIGENGVSSDFEVIGDIAQAVPFDMTAVPLYVTLAKVDTALVLDPSAEEYSTANAIILCGVNNKQEVCALRKKLAGSFSPAEVQAAISLAKNAAVSLFLQLNNVAEAMIEDDRKFPDLPPVRVGLLA